ncbi:MAG TPA: hypothetical protein VD962_02445 [Rubricoccaceae bacterium]|nr:hypothetical protein [Rubricoccaceae bacterium]
MPDEPINFYKEAFTTPANLLFLIVALVSALAIGGFATDLILLFAAAAELIYLGTVPRSDRFKRLVRSRRAAETNKPPSDREVFRELSREDQRRYVLFRNLEKKVKDNYAKLPYASQGMLDAHLKKIDGLLDAYLNLLQLKERYGRFTHSTADEEIARAIAQLRAEMANDPPRVAAIKQRRVTILEKRLDKFKKASENLAIIEAQLETIEDVTKYVYEQSLTMRNPEEVAFQLDTLVSEVEETQASVVELEDVFGDPLGGLTNMDLDVFDESRPAEEKAGRVDPALLDPDAPASGDGAARERNRERS